MEKRKILHITQSNGGVEEYLKMFFSHIDKEHFEVEIICPNYPSMIEEMKKLGVKVHVVNMKRNMSLFSDLKDYIKIKKYIKSSNPDIVHVHSSKAGVIGRIAAVRSKVPCVYNAHGWSFSMDTSKMKKMIYAFIERICARYTAKIINISDGEKKLAIKYKIAKEDKMITIYNGIDLIKYNRVYIRNDVLSKLNIPENAFVIGMVGRITKQKSPETFISIAERISRIFENAYFILVGDGDLKEEIQGIIEKKKLKDKVIITGWTNEVAKYVSIFDIGILTSKWEGFGLVLAEYMAMGKPIIASNVGGIPYVIEDGFNGELIDNNDVNDFVNHIIKLKNDVTLCDKYITNGYDVVNNKFNIKRVVKEHQDLYMEIIKQRDKKIISYKSVMKTKSQ